MDNFEYRVTLIIPVYNVEKYIDNCLYSVVSQTIDKSEIEVLLINDGSTDNSLEICYDFERNFDFFKVFTKENEGLSATRNFGIRRARGKYLMYLDSDDTFTPETIKNVIDFFDEHYDEVDLVTYPIVPYKDNKPMAIHYRYKILTQTDIYDLNDEPLITQTTINVVTKNLFKNNILFDQTPHFRHEDQKYSNYILMDKMKIGFCKEAEYKYLRNSDSITMTIFNPIELFETSTKYYEDMFDIFKDYVPKYIQSMFLHDLSWKLKENVLFPYHYDKNEFDRAVNRIVKLLQKVDNNIILSYPNNDKFLTSYFLQLKNQNENLIYVKNNEVFAINKTDILFKTEKFEIVYHKITMKNGKLRLLAFVKSPIFNYTNIPANVIVIENKNIKKQIEVFKSSHSYYANNHTKTCDFWAFDYTCYASEVSSFRFKVELDGVVFNTTSYFMPVSCINKKINRMNFVRENIKISFEKNLFTLEQILDEQIDEYYEYENQKYIDNSNIYMLRKMALSSKKVNKIWIYNDAYTVEKDNAYYQFKNDFKYKDGIKRYYICTNMNMNLQELFTIEELNFVIEFGSEKHKLLYLSCQKVFTSFFGYSPISPFLPEIEQQPFMDIIDFEVIYLQHGVLHASLQKYNSVEKCRADKIVVSSYFEIENYIKNYNYKESDLIRTGMARYDYISKEDSSINKILFAPSWRKYLTIERTGIKWDVLPEKFIQSNYYKNIQEFINNEKLINLLEENDLLLDFKPHPIVLTFDNLFVSNSDRINILNSDVNLTNYKAFITDFSSFVFDYAYLNRPIFYFVPDMTEFKAGMNHYKELDLPFEDAFGELTETAEDAVNALEKIINNNFVPEKNYSDRMENFYLPLYDCCEKLYDYLTEN